MLTATVYAVTSTWPPAIGDIRLAVPPADWRVALFLVAGAMVSTMFFALAPAFQATRLELVRAMRGEVVRDARPGRARNVLVALQVTASVLLLICSAIFLRSALGATTIDPGVRTADTVFVASERAGARRPARSREERSVGRLGRGLVAGRAGWRAAFARRPQPPSPEAQAASRVAYTFVSPEFFSVLGIDIVRGRGFGRPSGAEASQWRSCRKAPRAGSRGPDAQIDRSWARAGPEGRRGRARWTAASLAHPSTSSASRVMCTGFRFVSSNLVARLSTCRSPRRCTGPSSPYEVHGDPESAGPRARREARGNRTRTWARSRRCGPHVSGGVFLRAWRSG